MSKPNDYMDEELQWAIFTQLDWQKSESLTIYASGKAVGNRYTCILVLRT